MRHAALEPCEIDQSQHVRDFPHARRIPHPESPEPEGHVRSDVEMGEQRVVLEHHAAAPPRGWQRRDVLAADHDAPGIRRLEAGDEAQDRGLPAAGRAEQRQDLTPGDLTPDRSHDHRGGPLLAHARERHEPRHDPDSPPTPLPRTLSSQ